MKKFQFISLFFIVLALLNSFSTFAGRENEEKRAKCIVPFVNYMGRGYQMYCNYKYDYIFSFEPHTVADFDQRNLNKAYLFCVSQDDGYFPKKQNGEKVKLKGRWTYHLFPNEAVTEAFSMLIGDEDVNNMCQEGYYPYASTDKFVYSIIFYQNDGREDLVRLTSDKDLAQTYYYAKAVRYLGAVKTVADGISKTMLTIKSVVN